MLLHNWFQEEFRFGYAEDGERCGGCKKEMPRNEQCIVLRQRHLEKELWGPPIEVWCLVCADLLDGTPYQIKVGPRGGEIRREDYWKDGVGQVVREFWRGIRDEGGRRVQMKRKWY